MSNTNIKFHQSRGTTRASSRRALKRLAASIDAKSSDLVNPGGSTNTMPFNGTQITQSGFSCPGASVATIVTGNAANYDINGWFSSGANDRITVGTTGYYLLQAFVFWNTTAAAFTLEIVQNAAGSGVLGLKQVATSANYQSVASVVKLTANDYVRVQLTNPGAAATVNTLLTAVLIGT